jgi:hypothetical protein
VEGTVVGAGAGDGKVGGLSNSFGCSGDGIFFDGGSGGGGTLAVVDDVLNGLVTSSLLNTTPSLSLDFSTGSFETLILLTSTVACTLGGGILLRLGGDGGSGFTTTPELPVELAMNVGGGGFELKLAELTRGGGTAVVFGLLLVAALALARRFSAFDPLTRS